MCNLKFYSYEKLDKKRCKGMPYTRLYGNAHYYHL